MTHGAAPKRLSEERIGKMSEETTQVLENRSDYEGENVDILRDAAHIRARPAVYISDTATKGLHHLAYELVYNSVDEALAGYCKNIHVTVHVDGSLSVNDDGRAIPVDMYP